MSCSQNNTITGTFEVAAGTLHVVNGFPNFGWGIFASGVAAHTWQVDTGAVLATGLAAQSNNDSFVINNGGLWSQTPGYGWDSYNYFNSITMSGGTIAGGWLRANSATIGVTINASPGGSLISSGFNGAFYQSSGTLAFNVAHNGSAPYDLLLTGYIADYPNSNYIGNMTVVKSGPGLMVMAGSNTYSGPTTVAGGTLQIGNGASGEYLASPTITLSNNAVVAFNHADGLSYGGTISGSGQLIKLGTGNLDLVGSGTYSGPTTISAGTLELDGNGDNLPAATALTIAASGVLDLAGNPLTVGSLSGSDRGGRHEQIRQLPRDVDGGPVLRRDDDVRREHHRQQCTNAFRQRRIDSQRHKRVHRRDDRQRRDAGHRRAQALVGQRVGDDRRRRTAGLGQRRGHRRIACGLVAGRFGRGCLECGGVGSGDDRRI